MISKDSNIMSTINDLLDYGKKQLELSGNEYAKYERKVLLEHVLKVNYMYMLMNGDETVPEDRINEYKRLIELRCGHYPLQYIIGEAHFMDYTFFVNENVLIPRNDTEVLVETVNELLDNPQILSENRNGGLKVLDLCCGSGCIGISFKLYHRDTKLTLSDISKDALAVARKNLERHGIEDADINCGDLFENNTDSYDIILCNPPYIESAVVETLMPEVKDYEPHIALDGGEDGLDYYKRIIDESIAHLEDNGYIFFEIGYNQGKAVSDLMENRGFSDVKLVKDYAGLDRVVYGHL